MKTVMSHPIPHNLEECFAQLETMFEDEEQKERFKEPDRKGKCSAYKYHHGVGRWIRNNWGFWKKEGPLYDWMVSIGLHHADDMSGLILDAFWYHLNGCAFSVEEKVNHYREYWKNMEELDVPGGTALNYTPEATVRTSKVTFSTKKNFRVKETHGTRVIAKERIRQIYDEGFTTEHDIQNHPNEELLKAAICYAVAGLKTPFDLPDDLWPFDKSWDKRDKNPSIRNLELAGALIAAEIDRRHTTYIDESCSEEQEISCEEESKIK